MSESSDIHDSHHHGHVPGPEDSVPDSEALDPASRALAEALKVSFVVLKIVMICVVAFFIYSGAFEVAQNENAVVLRFGRLGDVERTAIKEPGWHWAWPYPIEEVVKIPSPKAVQTLTITDFWYYQSDRQEVGLDDDISRAELQYGRRDGYSLTASRTATEANTALAKYDIIQQELDDGGTGGAAATDYNLVHTEWQIRYRIIDPLPFLEHIWDGTKGDRSLGTGWYAVEKLLRSVLADAVIVTSANRTLHAMIWDKASGPLVFRDEVSRRMSQRLGARQFGLGIELDLIRIETPKQVKRSFDRAAGAHLKASEEVAAAEGKASEIIGEALGQRYGILGQADSYRTSITRAAQSDAEYIKKVLSSIQLAARQKVAQTDPDYQAKRAQVEGELLRVTVDELYQEMLRDVMEGADETFMLNSSAGADVEWRPLLNRDASLSKPAGIVPEPVKKKILPLKRPSMQDF